MDGHAIFSENIQTRTLPDQIYDYIKSMIMNLELKPGDKIPEDKIAENLGVSRTPIREAIRKLQQYGIVEVVPRRFAKVVEIDMRAKHNLGEIRIAIDKISVRRLAEIATEEHCDALRMIADNCVNLAETGNRVELFECDSDLHIAIAVMSGNPYLEDIVRSLNAKVQLLLANSYHGIKYSRNEQFSHYKIIESIRAHDVENAVELAEKHLRKFYFADDPML